VSSLSKRGWEGASSSSNVVCWREEKAGGGLSVRYCVSSVTTQFDSIVSGNGHRCRILASISASNVLVETISLHVEGRDWERCLLSSKLMEGEGKGLCWHRSSSSSGRLAVAAVGSREILVGISRRIVEV